MNDSTLLENIGLFLWVFDFLILLTVATYARRKNVFSSTLITLLIVVVIDGVMNSYTPVLKTFIRENNPPDGNTFYHWWGLFGWYVGFMVWNIIAMFAIWKIHAWYERKFSVPTFAYLCAYFCLTLLQGVRYGDRLLVDSETVKVIYKTGVLSVNIGTTLVSLVVVVGVTASYILNQKGYKGLSWSL